MDINHLLKTLNEEIKKYKSDLKNIFEKCTNKKGVEEESYHIIQKTFIQTLPTILRDSNFLDNVIFFARFVRDNNKLEPDIVLPCIDDKGKIFLLISEVKIANTINDLFFGYSTQQKEDLRKINCYNESNIFQIVKSIHPRIRGKNKITDGYLVDIVKLIDIHEILRNSKLSILALSIGFVCGNNNYIKNTLEKAPDIEKGVKEFISCYLRTKNLSNLEVAVNIDELETNGKKFIQILTCILRK